MPLPTTPDSWLEQFDLPASPFGTGRGNYELYEEDDAFTLSVEMPGFDTDDISVAWDEGVLNISAEREDDQRGEFRTYHQRFRFPSEVDADAITAEYTNGVLEVTLPTEATITGREIEVQ